MIYTREELIDKLEELLWEYMAEENSDKRNRECANKVADLISTLNDDDKEEWKNIP